MEYNKHKSVTIPNQVMPLRELLHRFTNGVPISENLERQGSYDFAKPFTSTFLPSDEMFDIGHDVNEIDITIVEQKRRDYAKQGKFKKPAASKITEPVDPESKDPNPNNQNE